MSVIVVPGLYLISGITLYAGISHIFSGFRHPTNKSQILFGLSALSAFAYNLAFINTLQADNVEQFSYALKWGISILGLQLSLHAWFAMLHAKLRLQKIVWLISTTFLVLSVINITQPYSLQYKEISHLRHFIMPWGESVTVAVGSTNAWIFLAGPMALLTVIFYIYCLFKRYKAHPNSINLGMLLAGLFLVATVTHGFLVRISVIDFIPLGPFGYIGMIIAMSLIISYENRMRSKLASHVYEGSIEGMIVTDENHSITSTNKAFTDITGYHAEEVIGIDPKFLSSGRHDKTFFEVIWEEISIHGKWRGEIWSRRKNAQVFPAWVNINVVKDNDGRTINYVAGFTDISTHKHNEEKIHQLAFYDELTQLPNRRMFLILLKNILKSRFTRKRRSGAILFISIDNFKRANEVWGYQFGNLLLVEVAKRIQINLKNDETLARLDGDEFAIIQDTESSGIDKKILDAKTLASKIQDSMSTSFEINGEKLYSKISIGISLFGDFDSSPELLMKQADAAMIQSKRIVDDKIHFFDAKMQAATEYHAHIESLLRLAIPDQLRLFYQLKVDAHGKALGAEALIRWQDPEKGMISPADFIPLAEETGLILPIGRWVFETACRQINAWSNDDQTKHLVIAVNVSPRQFQQHDFVDQVLETLNETGADPSKIELELTESMLLENIDNVIEKMMLLRYAGVSFSLDDFGTGYSSLSYLKLLPINNLKIDQSFVRDITIDDSDASIVKTIISLGQNLGLDVIAEGVETEQQMAFLAANGCRHFQGYLISKPLPLEEFQAVINRFL